MAGLFKVLASLTLLISTQVGLEVACITQLLHDVVLLTLGAISRCLANNGAFPKLNADCIPNYVVG